jgi:hypothetical protein
VRHVALVEGDGAGYDVKSFQLDGTHRFIEVKTTRDRAESAFFITANEVEFPKTHAATYSLYGYTSSTRRRAGIFYVQDGSLLRTQRSR